MLHKIVSIFIFIFLVGVLNSFSEEIDFERIDMSSGLSHNSALCLLEDHEGFVWVGTRDGLNKYDGTSIEIFKHEFSDSTSLVNNHVNCLFETQNNEIWVGTANGLCTYNSKTNKFQTFPLFAEQLQFESYYVRAIFESKDGKMWVGTTNGLYIIDKQRKNIEIRLFHPEFAHPAKNIREIYEDSKGVIWCGTSDGLYKSDGDKLVKYFSDEEADVNQLVVRAITEAENGLLWIGTERHGIYVLDTQANSPEVKFKMNTTNNLLPSNTVRSIFFENHKKVWIGTFGGLHIYNTQTKKYINYSHTGNAPVGIKYNSVRDIISDSHGGIWVAIYQGGVNYYHPQKNMFQHRLWQSQYNADKSNVISVLLEDDKNNLWLASEGGGVYQTKDEGISISKKIKLSKNDLTENTVKALSLNNNKLWIGTLTGLSSYDLTTQKLERFLHDPSNKNSLNSGHVSAILPENNTKIWIGTNGGGVQIFNPETSQFTNVEPLKNQHVRCFFKDSKNRIWIGCEEKLFLMNSFNNGLIDLSEELENWFNSDVDVIYISEDSKQNIWFGTRGRGLYLLKNNKLFWFNTGNGLIDNTVNSLLEGTENQYWITTNKGLSKISFKESSSGELQLESQTYSLSQGVQGLQFSPNCALKASSGKLFFGGINGLNSFYPKRIIENDSYPNLVFTELRVDYKLITSGIENSPLKEVLNETKALTLNYNQRDFSISFAGINFINPDKNNYRYKVAGLNDSWVEMANKSNINFTYFPVGTYEIQVQVSTNPQKWGTEYRSLQVTVLPPWWKTWWAFLAYSAGLGLLLILFFFLSQRWAKLKNQLAMQQFQRDKENELHQLKLKFYTDVSHELRTPLTLILAPLENLISKTELSNRLRNQLTQIQRSGFRLMQLVNQILDLRKLETGHERLQVAEGNIIRFFSELSLAFKEVASSKNISFDFVPLKKELNCWYDRDKLEIITNNLLSNAFKFTPAGGKVRLELNEISGQEIKEEFLGLSSKNMYLEISVVDNGEGINPEDLSNIYKRFYSKKEKSKLSVKNAGVGLELTRRMVELHKGGISVLSGETTEGLKETTFSVYLSLNKSIYSSEELDFDFKDSEDPSLYTSEFLQRETVIAAQEEEQEREPAVANEEFERLLIVEDNAEVRSFIRELFADDYEISEAENGESGLQKAIETNPQLIISDVMMPVMDGIELCKKIKSDARTSHIPVVLLTARTALTFKYEGLETGADDYITKPFSARYLSLRVKNLIKQRKSIQEHFKREAICDPGSITLTSIDEKVLKKAVDYITDNMSDSSINVNKISEHVGLSRVHFYRKIKALTNQTAVEFIRNVRLKRAATLLAQNKLSVKEVRNMTGFEDADYFRKCFKEQFGVTPTEYAKKSV